MATDIIPNKVTRDTSGCGISEHHTHHISLHLRRIITNIISTQFCAIFYICKTTTTYTKPLIVVLYI